MRKGYANNRHRSACTSATGWSVPFIVLCLDSIIFSYYTPCKLSLWWGILFSGCQSISPSLTLWLFPNILMNIHQFLQTHWYQFNQWLEFDQTSTYTSLGWEKEVIRFWWPWPYFQGHLHYKDSKSEPCVRSISWINRWNLTKLAQIHHWDDV